MKHIIFIIVFVFIAAGASAQKVVRDSIRLGNKAFEEFRFNDAESFFKSAIANDPSSKDASFNLANTYYKQSKWDEALKEYQHYLALESENKENMGAAWHNIGNTMLKKKDLKQAMEAYKKALRFNPKDDEARYNLAVVQKILKDQEENEDKKKQPDQNDQKEDQQKKDQDKKQNQQDEQNQQQNKDDQQKKPEQQDGEQQMSRENANQILQAIEEDEKQTQEKVNRMKASERKKQNEENKRQNKDW